VKLLIDACPRQLLEPDHRQITPLHAALAFGSSADIILLLLKFGPYTLRSQRETGHYPLHYIPTIANVALQNQMVDGYPEALRQLNSDSQTPFLCACICAVLVQILRCLVERFPVACLIGQEDNGAPYDCFLHLRSQDAVALDFMGNTTKDVVCFGGMHSELDRKHSTGDCSRSCTRDHQCCSTGWNWLD
jgi:hypothetical protein